jgi:hypothetical protein
MITGALIGDKELIARLGQVPQRMKDEVDATVIKLGYALQRKVQVDYLTGQVLRVRTGRLRSSIAQGSSDSRTRFESTPNTSIAYVGTNVSYGVEWERGIAARDIVPIRAKALRFEINGEVLFRKRAHIPAQAPRKFLEPALFEMRPIILQQFGAALKRGMQSALKP